MPAQRVGEACRAGERGRDHGDEDHDAGQADEHAQDVDDGSGRWPSNASAMPTSGARSQRVPSWVCRIGGIRGERDEGDQEGDDDRERRSDEEAPRERAPGLARLGGQVRDRLQTRVGEHRERDRERDRRPTSAPSRGRCPCSGARPRTGAGTRARSAAEADERDPGDRDREPVQARAAHEAEPRPRRQITPTPTKTSVGLVVSASQPTALPR